MDSGSQCSSKVGQLSNFCNSTQRPIPLGNYLANEPHGGIIMAFGGNDWLALTVEPALEPDIPICDPHHHFWDLRPASTPYQRYLIHELNADIYSGHNVRSTVFVEAGSMYLSLIHI